MKVIGLADSGYIAFVSHAELEKVVDRYYGKLDALKVGSEMHLGDGHNFRGEIRDACRKMIDASEEFKRAQNMMLKFAAMVSALPAESEGGES